MVMKSMLFNETTGMTSVFSDLPRHRGINDKAKFAVTYSTATRRFTVTYSDGAGFMASGLYFKKAVGSESPAAHANTLGKYYLYFNQTGVLTVSTTIWDVELHCPLAAVYYRPTGPVSWLFEDRHPLAGMTALVHKAHHIADGLKHGSGMDVTGYVLNTAGAANLSYAVSAGIVVDDDLILTTAAIPDGGPYRVAWLTGTDSAPEWNWSDTSVTGILDNGADLYYNQNNAGTWTRTAVANNGRWVNYWIVATTSLDGSREVVAIMGQTLFTTLANAQAESGAALKYLQKLFDEAVIIGRFIYERVSSSSPSSARIVEFKAYNRKDFSGEGIPIE